MAATRAHPNTRSNGKMLDLEERKLNLSIRTTKSRDPLEKPTKKLSRRETNKPPARRDNTPTKEGTNLLKGGTPNQKENKEPRAPP